MIKPLVLVLVLVLMLPGCLSYASWNGLQYPVDHLEKPLRVWRVGPNELVVALDRVYSENPSIYPFVAQKHAPDRAAWMARYRFEDADELDLVDLTRVGDEPDVRVEPTPPPNALEELAVEQDAVTIEGTRYRLVLERQPSVFKRGLGIGLLPITVPLDVALSPFYLIGFVVVLAFG